jgi:sarcosine oxidase subunit alpha
VADKMLQIQLNGSTLSVEPGVSVAAALLNAGVTLFRRSASGEPRAPLCGMGICFDCRVTINGVAHQRACLELVHHGMEVVTDR